MKTTTFKFRLSQDDKDQIEANAKAAGLSASAYIISRCVGTNVGTANDVPTNIPTNVPTNQKDDGVLRGPSLFHKNPPAPPFCQRCIRLGAAVCEECKKIAEKLLP